jgi:hypothetical protein
MYVRISFFALTAMLNCSMRTTLHSENVGMNDAFEYLGRCFVNSFFESARFIRFHSLWPKWIKYLKLMSYQPSGLHASQTLHLQLYVRTAKPRKRIELVVWEIYIESHCISVPDMEDFVDC